MVGEDTAPQGGQETAEPATQGPVEPQAEVDAALDRDASQEVMSLLSEHVPLALLADLAIPEGPASPQILSEEGLPEVAWWEGGESADAEDGAAAR